MGGCVGRCVGGCSGGDSSDLDLGDDLSDDTRDSTTDDDHGDDPHSVLSPDQPLHRRYHPWRRSHGERHTPGTQLMSAIYSDTGDDDGGGGAIRQNAHHRQGCNQKFSWGHNLHHLILIRAYNIWAVISVFQHGEEHKRPGNDKISVGAPTVCETSRDSAACRCHQ